MREKLRRLAGFSMAATGFTLAVGFMTMHISAPGFLTPMHMSPLLYFWFAPLCWCVFGLAGLMLASSVRWPCFLLLFIGLCGEGFWAWTWLYHYVYEKPFTIASWGHWTYTVEPLLPMLVWLFFILAVVHTYFRLRRSGILPDAAPSSDADAIQDDESEQQQGKAEIR